MATDIESANGKKEWCVMVYLAADIDLESAAFADLEQMKAAGSSSQVDLLAQVNRGGSRPIRRYYLQKETYLEEDVVPTVDKNGQFLLNENARNDLIQFIEWCARSSNAKRYVLILWGHGQGWKAESLDPCFVPGAGNPQKSVEELVKEHEKSKDGLAIKPAVIPLTLANGQTGFLSNTDLHDVLAAAKTILNQKIEILGLDACLMAMSEVCCQVDESVNYLVACEDTVPDESWPYDSILKLLVAHPEMPTEVFGRLIIQKFIFDFGRKRKYVTQSMCRLGQDNQQSLNYFTSAVKRLVAALLNNMNDAELRWAMMIARTHVQSFFIREYVDLYDFCRLLSINCNNQWVVSACEDVMQAIAGAPSANGSAPASRLVVDNGTYGYPLKRSFGVSIYFPCVGAVPQCYPKLEFCKRTDWHLFLGAFLSSPTGNAAREEKPVPVPKPAPAEKGTPKPAPAPAPAFAENVNEVAVVESNGVKTTLGDVIKTTHGDVIKTTLGDVIKTTHGDVIKTTLGDEIKTTLGDEIKTTLGDVIKTTHGDEIKTTHGDVIKTTHGDPIKTPDLPDWYIKRLPWPTPNGPTPAPAPAPDRGLQKDGDPIPDRQCNCGHKP